MSFLIKQFVVTQNSAYSICESLFASESQRQKFLGIARDSVVVMNIASRSHRLELELEVVARDIIYVVQNDEIGDILAYIVEAHGTDVNVIFFGSNSDFKNMPSPVKIYYLRGRERIDSVNVVSNIPGEEIELWGRKYTTTVREICFGESVEAFDFFELTRTDYFRQRTKS